MHHIGHTYTRIHTYIQTSCPQRLGASHAQHRRQCPQVPLSTSRAVWTHARLHALWPARVRSCTHQCAIYLYTFCIFVCIQNLNIYVCIYICTYFRCSCKIQCPALCGLLGWNLTVAHAVRYVDAKTFMYVNMTACKLLVYVSVTVFKCVYICLEKASCRSCTLWALCKHQRWRAGAQLARLLRCKRIRYGEWAGLSSLSSFLLQFSFNKIKAILIIYLLCEEQGQLPRRSALRYMSLPTHWGSKLGAPHRKIFRRRCGGLPERVKCI